MLKPGFCSAIRWEYRTVPWWIASLSIISSPVGLLLYTAGIILADWNNEKISHIWSIPWYNSVEFIHVQIFSQSIKLNEISLKGMRESLNFAAQNDLWWEKISPILLFTIFAIWPFGKFQTGQIELYGKDYARKFANSRLRKSVSDLYLAKNKCVNSKLYTVKFHLRLGQLKQLAIKDLA